MRSQVFLAAPGARGRVPDIACRAIEDPDLTYYAVTAQVLPLLFLALVFETRIFRESRQQSRPRRRYGPGGFFRSGDMTDFVLVTVGVLIIGEILALRVLAQGSASELDQGLVGVALAFALGLLAARTVADALRANRDDVGPWVRENTDLVGGLVGTSVIVAAAVLLVFTV